MKVIAINNYKDINKSSELVENLNRCIGQPVQLLDYKLPRLQEHVETINPDAVILSGSSFMLAKSDTRLVFENELDLIGKLQVPILGVCFGHQLIGTAFGSQVIDLGQRVQSMREVHIVKSDPVFDGLPNPIRVSESHRQGLSELPSGFELLAESSTSKVEAMVHHTRPIYGVQFHPERGNEKHPHGRIIMENFLTLAMERKKQKSQITSVLVPRVSRLPTSP